MSLSSNAARTLRRALAAVSAAALGLLAACGGGTSQFESFVAERVFAFGDESSHLTSDGRKFSVNALAAAGGTAIDCSANPLWVQLVAGLYGFSFAECPATGATEFRAQMRAAPGARVAEVSAQIDAQVAAGGFNDKDLSLLLVGANDILELYAQFPERPEADLLAAAEQRGREAAGLVNRLVSLGSRVIVANVADMGLSPFAKAQDALFPGRAALLARLSAAFNDQLGVTVLLDGRFVGLVQTDLVSRAIARAPFFYGLVNASDAICTVALPDCTTATVVSIGEGEAAVPASAAQYFWADATRLSYGGQLQIANLAADRARRNPF